MYFDDSKGYVYPHGPSGTLNQGAAFLSILGDYLGLKGSPYYWDGSASDNFFYAKSRVVRCPANSSLRLRSHYGYNDWMAQQVQKITQFRKPSSILIWCDVASGTNSSCTIGYWSWASGNSSLDYWPIRDGNTEPQKHAGAANVLWGDMHASKTKQVSPLPSEWAY